LAIIEAVRQKSVIDAFARLRFENGERALLSLAPTGLVAMKLIFRGMLPAGKIWSCSDPQVDAWFGPLAQDGDECIDTILRTVEDCQSIAEMRAKLDELKGNS